MKHKVLIADDSLTIQKVIQITLANEPYELTECSKVEDLISSVEAESPALVLLDFNLSEEKTGYDLSKEIKAVNSNTKILMLLGTFDSVDEDLLAASGCEAKIVKPFDGNKFINTCRNIFGNDEVSSNKEEDEVESDFPGIISSDEKSEDLEDTEWVMDSPEIEDEVEESPVEMAIPSTINNPLEESMNEWGMEVPSIIGTSQKSPLEFPEVIEGNVNLPNAAEVSVSSDVITEEEANSLPSDDDLAYPNGDDLEYPDEILLSSEVVGEETNSSYEIKPGGTETQEDLANLEAQIEEEIDHSEDLWAADEVEISASLSVLEDVQGPDEIVELQLTSESVTEEISGPEANGGPEDFPADVMDEVTQEDITFKKESLTNIIPDDLEDKLKEKLTPVMEQFVKEYCKESIEKIAWEIIPELAENLIQKEIQKITDSVLKP